MTGRRKVFVAAILGGMPLLLGTVAVQPASAHGSMANPVSRVYSCFLEGPEHPVSSAHRARNRWARAGMSPRRSSRGGRRIMP